jgi:hypothetical protein
LFRKELLKLQVEAEYFQLFNLLEIINESLNTFEVLKFQVLKKDKEKEGGYVRYSFQIYKSLLGKDLIEC